MASIHKETHVMAPPAAVWSAARDVGALHLVLVPGFVTHTELVAGASPVVRLVTFGNGLTVREVIVSIDDDRRRLVWKVESDRLTHHNGVLQIFEHPRGGSRVSWIADLLPDEMAATFAAMMDQGLEAMKRCLEEREAAR
jgi:hypothetical protein